MSDVFKLERTGSSWSVTMEGRLDPIGSYARKAEALAAIASRTKAAPAKTEKTETPA